MLGRWVIPWLARLKFGQTILEEGPKWHMSKQGTPTMGGVMFIVGIFVSAALVLVINTVTGNKLALTGDMNTKLWAGIIMALMFGLVGFADDYIKVVKKRNLGLTAKQKFLSQAVISVIYILVLMYTNNLNSEIIIPFLNKAVNLPLILYVIFTLFVVTGTVNAVNLTDGLDGLATSITIIVSLFFAIVAILVNDFSGACLSLAVCGGCIGFLFFNKYPAKVFMGDTGSLFLGGAISCIAVGMKMPLILVIAGFVYLFETLSVIIQVASFKLTGKRVFKMSPIHHHFEMCGWKEKKIVLVFSLVTFGLCLIAFLSLIPVILG